MTAEIAKYSSSADTTELTEPQFEYLAEGLLRKVEERELVDRLGQEGVPTGVVVRQIELLRESPTFRAARKIQREQRKLQSLVDALSTQWSRSPTATSVPSLHCSEPERFFQHYLFANRPVVIEGLTKDWPALSKWSPAYFAEVYGEHVVEIMSGRSGDENFEENMDSHRHHTTMGDFAAYVASEQGNDRYLVARNQVLSRPEFKSLLDDIAVPQEFLKPGCLAEGNMWMGPRGTRTPLHHDNCNVLFAQIYGSKRVQLIEPHNLSRVYNDRGVFSAVDIDDIDLSRFPKMASVPIAEVVVEAGDTLFIPMGWWHAVESLSPAISLSFTKFTQPSVPVRWRST